MGLQTWIRRAAVSTAALSMVLSPVAEGAQAERRQKERVEHFVKFTGLGGQKTVTVGEFYRRVRDSYPASIRPHLDIWATINKDRPMPKMDVQTFKDTEGKERYRLVFREKGRTFAISTGDGFIKLGAVKITAEDTQDPKKILRLLAAKEPYLFKRDKKQKKFSVKNQTFVLSRDQFSRLTAEQKAVYFFHLRRALQDAERILMPAKRSSATNLSPFEVLFALTLGEPAGAQDVIAPAGGSTAPTTETPATSPTTTTTPTARPSTASPVPRNGGSCIVAGYKSTYGENLSCGGMTSGRQDFTAKINQSFTTTFPKSERCSSGTFPCNPLVYGFSSGGKPYCVGPNTSEINQATSNCNNKSPLGANNVEDRKRIVQSWVTAMGKDDQLEFDSEGKVREDQYDLIKTQLEELNSYISDAIGFCESEEGQKLQAKRADQKSACEAIKVRAFELQKFSQAPPEPPAAQCADFPGSKPEGDQCVCTDGQVETKSGDQRLCGPTPAVVTAPASDIVDETPDDTDPAVVKVEEEEDDCGFFCEYGAVLAGVAILGAIVACVGWFCFPDSNVKTPEWIPPVEPKPGHIPKPNKPRNPKPHDAPKKEGGSGAAPVNGGGVNGNR